MVHANSLSAQPWLAEDNKALAGRNHFLHVMQVKRSASERPVKCVGVRFLQRALKIFFQTAETPQRSLYPLSAETNRNIAFFARKLRKFRPVFMASRKMRKQTFHRFNAEPPQREKLRARDPI